MTRPGTIPGLEQLCRRWTLPVIAAWLLHMGLWWLIFFVVEPSAMSALTRTVNWFIEHFSATAWPIENISLSYTILAFQFAEALVSILLGLTIGWWLLWHKTRAAQQPR